MTTIANNTFAAACYDTNTAAEQFLIQIGGGVSMKTAWKAMTSGLLAISI